MNRFQLDDFLAFRDDFSLSELSLLEIVEEAGRTWLFAGSTASGALNQIELNTAGGFIGETTNWQTGAYRALPMSEGIVVRQNAETCLISLDGMSGGVVLQDLAADGTVQAPAALRLANGSTLVASKLETVSTGDTTWIATADGDGSGINLYRLNSDWTVSLTNSVQDNLKANAQGVSELRSVNVGNTEFLVAASASENGLTSYRVTQNGRLEHVDSIGSRDGLWTTGLSALEEVEVGGQTFLIGAGTQSGTLSVVRMNSMGVFFPTDVEFDDRTTRFAGASVIDSFEVSDRDFIVVAGTDGGLSMFEVMPGGTLYHLQNAIQDTDWNIGAVSGMTTYLNGDQVHVFIAGTGDGGLAHLSIDMSGLGIHMSGTRAADQITGTAGADVIMGGDGDDTIHGGTGDDIIFAGAGENRLRGGEGEDIFVLSANSIGTRIEDFEPGVDRIDLDGWGLIYDVGSLDISARNRGAAINWRNNEVNITTMDRTRIEVDDWDSEDFIF